MATPLILDDHNLEQIILKKSIERPHVTVVPSTRKFIAIKKTGKWTNQEDDTLKNFVTNYGEKQWKKSSVLISGRSAIQCFHRWSKILKPGLIKGPWTVEEDDILRGWVKKEGPQRWSQAATLIKGRSGKQCRERWFNTLDPDVRKGNWSQDEDKKIFHFYEKYGSSWSKIAKEISGRTENAIKNRFYSTTRKIISDRRKKAPVHKSLINSIKEEENELSQEKNPNNTLYQLLKCKTPDNSQIHPKSQFFNGNLKNKNSNNKNLVKEKNNAAELPDSQCENGMVHLIFN